MTQWVLKMKNCFSDKKYIFSFIFAWALLILCLIVNFYAGTYATLRESNPVTDIILSNIRIYDVDGLFIYGPMVFWIFATLYAFINPRNVPFIVKSIALFIIIRSVFISVTHIGPFPDSASIFPPGYVSRFSFGGDLFFSGHTGLPFLLALIFWEDKFMRYLCIAASIFFAVVVLLAHQHYTIDVLAAFFITYTIYHIATRFFKEDFVHFSVHQKEA